jgi:hypothetical protein
MGGGPQWHSKHDIIVAAGGADVFSRGCVEKKKVCARIEIENEWEGREIILFAAIPFFLIF